MDSSYVRNQRGSLIATLDYFKTDSKHIYIYDV